MNNSYSLNKSPKIAKRLLVLLDMIVVVLTLALSVSALQRHFWTIGLWRPLASCLAHRPLHRHWFSFVALPLNIATPEIGGWFVNAVPRQYEVKLASGGGAPLLQCGSSESVDCRPVSEASVSSSVSPVAACTTGMKSASGLLRPPAATKRVSHVQTKQQQQAELPDGGWHRSWTLTFIRSTTKSVSRVQQLISCNFKICSYMSLGGTLRQH